MKKIAIIVAGGVGKRMDEEVPKQFILLRGKPILMHTLGIFWNYDSSMKIILVLPVNYADYWVELCRDHQFVVPHQTVSGGQSRFQSVKNAIQYIDEDSIVAIHDAVRPLVSRDTLERCFKTAGKYGNAVPVMDVPESVRRVTETGNISVDRTGLKLIQTPQVFKGELVISAYRQEYFPEFTDDAKVVEKAGYKIHLVEGNRENIKITTREDLIIAEAFLSHP